MEELTLREELDACMMSKEESDEISIERELQVRLLLNAVDTVLHFRKPTPMHVAALRMAYESVREFYPKEEGS